MANLRSGSPKRENPFNTFPDSGVVDEDYGESENGLLIDDFGLFDGFPTPIDRAIPVIECGTASHHDDSIEQEGGRIFNRLLRPSSPNTSSTPMASTRPRLVFKDDQEDDDCDLLCPVDAPLLGESLSSSTEGERRPHCHPPLKLSPEKRKAKIQLVVTSTLCFIFMIGEIAGGIVANSLALQTDAAHLASDLVAFLVSLFALWASGKPATKRMSFGFHRIEVLGALLSIVMIWILTAFLVFMAVERIIHRDYAIDSDAMIITAACGVAFNVIMCIVLHCDSCAGEMGRLLKHGHSHGHGGHAHKSSAPDRRQLLGNYSSRDVGHSSLHDLEDDDAESGTVSSASGNAPSPARPAAPDLVDNLPGPTLDAPPPALAFSGADRPPARSERNINVRAAIIHVIGDLIQSVGVLVAAYIIKYRPDDSYLVADPICTFLFSVLVLASTISVLRDVLTVLMEATPRDINYNQVKADLEAITGVRHAHSLHVWSLTLDKYALAVHLGVNAASDKQGILNKASQLLQQKYNIHHCTIQVEDFEESMSSCSRCVGPKK